MRKAVFIDKDGTLVENVPYNVDPARVVLTEGAAGACRTLARQGYRLFVVSNQPGIALGKFTTADLEALFLELELQLPSIDAFYFCPHGPGDRCACRKPACGMLERAAREHGLDLSGSWMVGDILDDVEAGRRAGCRTVLVDNGNETEWRNGPLREANCVVSNLVEAAHVIVNAEKQTPRSPAAHAPLHRGAIQR
jgi:D-glycero-D-manno-heptose 1,7-bisphosphate phosphatase